MISSKKDNSNSKNLNLKTKEELSTSLKPKENSNHPVWKVLKPYWKLIITKNLDVSNLWWFKEFDFSFEVDFTKSGELTNEGAKKVNFIKPNLFYKFFIEKGEKSLQQIVILSGLKIVNENKILFKALKASKKYNFNRDPLFKKAGIEFFKVFDLQFKLHKNIYENFQKFNFPIWSLLFDFNKTYLYSKLIPIINDHFKNNLTNLKQIWNWRSYLGNWWVLDNLLLNETDIFKKLVIDEKILNYLIENYNYDFGAFFDLNNTKIKNHFNERIKRRWKDLQEILEFGYKVTPYFLKLSFFEEIKLNHYKWFNKNFSLKNEALNLLLNLNHEEIETFWKINSSFLINQFNKLIWNHFQTLNPQLKMIYNLIPEFFKSSEWKLTGMYYPFDCRPNWKYFWKIKLQNSYENYSIKELNNFYNLTSNILISVLKQKFVANWNKLQRTFQKITLFPEAKWKNADFWTEFKFKKYLIFANEITLKQDFYEKELSNWDNETWKLFLYSSLDLINDLYLNLCERKWEDFSSLFGKAKDFNFDFNKEPLWTKFKLNWKDDIDSFGRIDIYQKKAYFLNLSKIDLKNILDISLSDLSKKLVIYINEKTGSSLKKIIDWNEVWRYLRNWYLLAKDNNLNTSKMKIFNLLNLDLDKDLDEDNFLKAETISKLNKLSNKVVFEISEEKKATNLVKIFVNEWVNKIEESQLIKKLILSNYNFDYDVNFNQNDFSNFEFFFDKEGNFKKTSLKKLEKINENELVTLWKFNIDYLEYRLTKQVINHWNKITDKLKSIFTINFDQKSFQFWNQKNQNYNLLLKNLTNFKFNDWKKVISEGRLNLEVFFKIDDDSMKKVVLKEIETHWLTFVNELKMMRDFSLLFVSPELWVSSGLNWETDLNQDAFLTEKGKDKVFEKGFYTWKKILNVSSEKILKIIHFQIHEYWLSLKVLLNKLKLCNSTFFETKKWSNTGISKKLDFNEVEIKLKEATKYFSKAQLSAILDIKGSEVKLLLEKEISIKWNEIKPFLKKIFIFEEKIWRYYLPTKKYRLNFKTDLDQDFNLNSDIKEKLIYSQLDIWNNFLNLNKEILEEILVEIFVKHWNNFKTVIKNAKSNKIDLSDSELWKSTNLSWQTDLSDTGDIQTVTKKTIPIKTFNQLKAISLLNSKDLYRLYQSKLSILNLEKEGVTVKNNVFQTLKNFFVRIFVERRKLFPDNLSRLSNQILLSDEELLEPIIDFKTFKNQEKRYKLLRKKFSKRIIDEGEIIGIVRGPTDMKKNVIELNNISKYFLTDKKINQNLYNINLKIEKGDFIVILGPSGAGKSSLLNLISGIDSTNIGDLFVNGINLSLLNSTALTKFRRRYVGFIFQKYNLLQNLTAKENVEISETLLPDFKNPISMMELFNFLEINGLENKYPYQLSGGEQQRFSIARALIKNPDILFCDEPTGALDQKMSRKVMKILMNINEKYKTTIIIVTHDPTFKKVAKTIIQFEDGNISNIYRNKNQIDPTITSFD